MTMDREQYLPRGIGRFDRWSSIRPEYSGRIGENPGKTLRQSAFRPGKPWLQECRIRYWRPLQTTNFSVTRATRIGLCGHLKRWQEGSQVGGRRGTRRNVMITGEESSIARIVEWDALLKVFPIRP
jgi:hypothetical protein